jgi:hypothetical protein
VKYQASSRTGGDAGLDPTHPIPVDPAMPDPALPARRARQPAAMPATVGQSVNILTEKDILRSILHEKRPSAPYILMVESSLSG